MTGWLLDTDVLSGFAPGRTPIGADVAAWFRQRSNSIFLSTITVAEIQAGIAKLQRTGMTRRAHELRSWFDRITTLYGERVLPFDLAAAHIAGHLSDTAVAAGRHPGFADVAIAAIAKANGLAVLTRNLRHFEVFGISLLNPLSVSG